MTDTTTNVLVDVVTAAQVRALKSADSIAFDLFDGQGKIRAIKRADRSPDGFEQTVNVYTNTTVQDYRGEGGYHRGPEGYHAFHYEGSAQYDDACRTLMARIKVGCTLTLKWSRNVIDCPALDQFSSLVGDDLVLLITHRVGKPETYLVHRQVCLDNTARMIKLGRTGF